MILNDNFPSINGKNMKCENNGNKRMAQFGNISEQVELSISNSTSTKREPTIAMVAFVHTSQLSQTNTDAFRDGLQTLYIANHFIPSLCETITSGYQYTLYIVVEIQPLLATNDGFNQFINVFNSSVHQQSGCFNKHITLKLSILTVEYFNNPTRAVNDAMLIAYLKGADYFYKLDDNSKFLTADWTKSFVKSLWEMSPRNVGAVGPTPRGTSPNILPHTFVHRTHLDIFGQYFPNVPNDFLSDVWLARVYGVDNMLAVPGHSVHRSPHGAPAPLLTPEENQNQTHQQKAEIKKGRITLNAWIHVEQNKRYTVLSVPKEAKTTKHKRIISLSLTGSSNNDVPNVIRTIEHLRHWFPKWTIRVYIENPSCCKYQILDTHITNYLTASGLELVYVNTNILHVKSCLWRYLIGDDLEVTHYLAIELKNNLNISDIVLQNQETQWQLGDENAPGFYHRPGCFEALHHDSTQLFQNTWLDMAVLYHKARNKDYCDAFISKYMWPYIQKYVEKH